jgi:PAS domain S-box-containing protein
MEAWRRGVVQVPGLDDRGSVFLAAVRMTRMPMIVTDPRQPDNPIVFANEAFQQLTGYTEAEVLGRNCRFLQGARTDREAVREIREAIADQRPVQAELLNYRRDGSVFWNALFVGPIFDTDDRLLYFFASQLDVTRRRASEDAYRQAQKMEAIGQLTAGLAHDFNNLLQVVQGNLQRIESLLDSPPESGAAPLRRALDNADRGARQAAKLTQQLLTFARRTRLDPKPINLNAVLMEFGDMLARTLGERIEIRLDLDPRLPAALADPVQVEMALLNVLVNARDAMPEGGRAVVSTGAVRLDAAAAAATGNGIRPGPYVALTVRDEGEGMTPEVMARATEPFFTTKSSGKGTGLGLAMVHGFLKQSGGRLEIESEPRRGTTVRMLLPQTRERPEPVEAAPARGDRPRTGRGERVLVVDDSVDVLDLAMHHLAELGYSPVPARSAEEALDLLDTEAGSGIALLFSDIVMPGGMNGLVLAERARRRRPGLRVLLTTGYNEDLVAQGPRTEGLDVLGKPYRRAELADRVRTALDRPLPEEGDRPVLSRPGDAGRLKDG